VALKAESVSKNLLASIDIHASIDVADAQLLSFFNVTEGLQFSIHVFQPNYVSIRIWSLRGIWDLNN